MRIEAAASVKTPGLEGLLSACRAHDGYAFLELASSLNAHKDMGSLFLAGEGDRLLGALYVFAPRKDEAEIGGLVLPESRRQGVFAAMLRAAEEELCRYGYRDELLVVDSRSAGGKSLASRLGAGHEYTEYAMRYAGLAPVRAPGGPELALERLGIDRLEALVELRSCEFGDSREETEDFERATFASCDRRSYGAFLGGRLVGACSLGYDGRKVSINGLVVDKASRGRGIGQALLGMVLAMLHAEGLEIELDVNSLNANAYHIYRKAGFETISAREYYRRRL
jgi:ribosomal protein S18 acetylase RimI-like enzyme